MTGKINVGKKVTEHHKVILKNKKRYSLVKPLTQMNKVIKPPSTPPPPPLPLTQNHCNSF